jgi:hypothetical protein
LGEEDKQEEDETVENEEHVKDLPDGAPTARGKDSTSENVSSCNFKQKKRNEIEKNRT